MCRALHDGGRRCGCADRREKDRARYAAARAAAGVPVRSRGAYEAADRRAAARATETVVRPPFIVFGPVDAGPLGEGRVGGVLREVESGAESIITDVVAGVGGGVVGFRIVGDSGVEMLDASELVAEDGLVAEPGGNRRWRVTEPDGEAVGSAGRGPELDNRRDAYAAVVRRSVARAESCRAEEAVSAYAAATSASAGERVRVSGAWAAAGGSGFESDRVVAALGEREREAWVETLNGAAAVLEHRDQEAAAAEAREVLHRLRRA